MMQDHVGDPPRKQAIEEGALVMACSSRDTSEPTMRHEKQDIHTQAGQIGPQRRRRWATLLGYTAAQAQLIEHDDTAHRRAIAQWLEAAELAPEMITDPQMPDDPVTRAQWATTHSDVAPQTAADTWPTDPSFPPPCLEGRRPVSGALRAGAKAREEFADTERVSGAEYARRTGMSVSTVNRTLREHADETGAPRRDARGRMNALRLASFLANVRNTSPRKIPAVYSLATLQAWPGPSEAPPMDPLWFGQEERLTLAEFCRRTDKDYGTAATALRNPTYATRAPERGKDGRFNARDVARFLANLPGRRGKRR